MFRRNRKKQSPIMLVESHNNILRRAIGERPSLEDFQTKLAELENRYYQRYWMQKKSQLVKESTGLKCTDFYIKALKEQLAKLFFLAYHIHQLIIPMVGLDLINHVNFQQLFLESKREKMSFYLIF